MKVRFQSERLYKGSTQVNTSDCLTTKKWSGRICVGVRYNAMPMWVQYHRERESLCVCVRERERECVCVCVRERERECV